MNELLAALINSEHEQCIASPTTALLHARNAGEWLIETMEQLSAEEWHSWLVNNCTLTERTAQTYIQIARNLPSVTKPAKVTNVATEVKEQTKEEIPENLSSIANVAVIISEQKITSIPDLITETEATENNLELEQSPNFTESVPTITTNYLIATTPATLTFFVPGTVVPKARPRVTSKGTYLPPRYRQWRNHAEVEISRQLWEQEYSQKLPLTKAAVKVEVRGSHRGDLDNILGSCLDALVSAGVLIDDRISVVPRLEVWHNSEGNTGALIEVRVM
ncbi:endodeoxyribonuclease RusA [Crinalium epipsammum PCC 9333]|uniref:Endodeoxyribonuclease RusA n=1 Tax=Crinalium epipsammum PCC 9333 TaxID=1173022 RepID=K9VX03_9CYAN|nr:RusA family crossover junction endodeoxyribonuclease [Crinalium epipsammum]AFZ11695.1 endodeoxyribonuclease RusA [Crinalium epipsammum PCC 9333]